MFITLNIRRIFVMRSTEIYANMKNKCTILTLYP